MKRLLAVEDDPVTLKLYGKAFDPQLYDVICMDSAEAALKYLATNRVDGIISDISMPGMDGIEFFQVLRKQNRLVTPFIFITAYYKPEYEDLLNSGVDLFLVKPVDFAKLPGYLAEFLS